MSRLFPLFMVTFIVSSNLIWILSVYCLISGSPLADMNKIILSAVVASIVSGVGMIVSSSNVPPST